jgi:hypothetical protein
LETAVNGATYNEVTRVVHSNGVNPIYARQTSLRKEYTDRIPILAGNSPRTVCRYDRMNDVVVSIFEREDRDTVRAITLRYQFGQEAPYERGCMLSIIMPFNGQIYKLRKMILRADKYERKSSENGLNLPDLKS